MMFRLTEDEIVKEASKDKEYCQLSVDVGMWAAREQFKRIADKIEDMANDGDSVGEVLKALREEIS